MADARVALALAREALRGFAKGAPRAQALCEASALLGDLVQQDIDEQPADGGGPEIRRGTARDRIVSTTDPEMRHGHKSHTQGFQGYQASVVAETTHGVSLATDVRAANVHDHDQAAELVETAAEQAGQPIARVLGDTAYGDTQTRAELAQRDVEVIAKAPPGARAGRFGVDRFRIDRRRRTARCPAGRRSIRRDRVRGEDPGWRYVFSRKDCGPCALRAQCTASRRAARVAQITKKTAFQVALASAVANFSLVLGVLSPRLALQTLHRALQALPDALESILWLSNRSALALAIPAQPPPEIAPSQSGL